MTHRRMSGPSARSRPW